VTKLARLGNQAFRIRAGRLFLVGAVVLTTQATQSLDAK
jgi:hypothetical protein